MFMVTFQTRFYVNMQHDYVGMHLKYVNMFMLILDSFFVSILCLQTSHSKLLLGFYHSVMDLGNFEWMLISATYVYSFITNK